MTNKIALNRPNRRFLHRRAANERRRLLRFELDDINRHSQLDRRVDNNISNNVNRRW